MLRASLRFLETNQESRDEDGRDAGKQMKMSALSRARWRGKPGGLAEMRRWGHARLCEADDVACLVEGGRDLGGHHRELAVFAERRSGAAHG